MQDLLLTLGHNSSAIAIIDGKIINGYEEERLSGFKSDSSFPEKAIAELGYHAYDRIYVSHWEPFCKLENMKPKHWRPDLLPKHLELHTLNMNFTHHDAHMYSTKAFLGNDILEMDKPWTIVCDGFGNFGETLTIYDPHGHIVHRTFGYLSSMGLMYQYATANLGMKMNEDEYKLLGYETMISQQDAIELESIVERIHQHLVKQFIECKLFKADDPLYDVSALVETQVFWDNMLAPCNRDKVKVAYVVQSALERMLFWIVAKYDMKSVILVGGVFMNVKANFRMCEAMGRKISVMPLSGDQGAALGLYKYHNPEFVMPNSLCWGRRNLLPISHTRTENFNSTQVMAKRLKELLLEDNIVNIVWGNMEFGPRALCHTSTLALPTMDNVNYINHVNGRNTIMPMGPVVTEQYARNQFDDYDKVVKSAKYMIMALEYHDIRYHIRGAAHDLPHGEGFTGRPQVVDRDDPVNCVIGPALSHFQILINTSFNIHGVPIVWESEQIEECIDYQTERDDEERVYTLILVGDNNYE